MKRLFLDTGYIIALESADDQHHAEAKQHWRAIVAAKPAIITTSLVLHETVTFFNRRGRHAKAVEIGERLRRSQRLTLIHVDEALFDEAWGEFVRHGDKRYSLTDCASFVVMRRHGIDTSLAFDRHFEQAGFTRLPAATLGRS